MTKVQNAIESLRKNLITVKFGEEFVIDKEALRRRSYGELLDGEQARNLRFDWELAWEDDSPQAWGYDLATAMADVIAVDIEDLALNGDQNNTQDALLNTMDGSVKMGKEQSQIIISSFALYREVKPRKKSTEYTLYLVLHLVY